MSDHLIPYDWSGARVKVFLKGQEGVPMEVTFRYSIVGGIVVADEFHEWFYPWHAFSFVSRAKGAEKREPWPS